MGNTIRIINHDAHRNGKARNLKGVTAHKTRKKPAPKKTGVKNGLLVRLQM